MITIFGLLMGARDLYRKRIRIREMLLVLGMIIALELGTIIATILLIGAR